MTATGSHVTVGPDASAADWNAADWATQSEIGSPGADWLPAPLD